MLENNICKVTWIGEGIKKPMSCAVGATILEVMNHHGLYIDAPCGGKGLCGKCKVRIMEGLVSPQGNEEQKLLSEEELEQGIRLACHTKVLGDLTLKRVGDHREAQIMTVGMAYHVNLSPMVERQRLQMPKPSLEDQRDDWSRLQEALGREVRSLSLPLLKKLPQVLRAADYEVVVTHDGQNILNITAGDENRACLGVAVDIGTTTVVAYLMDLRTGMQIDVLSQLNQQKAFGGDVISRIAYCMENADGLQRMTNVIVSQLDSMMEALAKKNNVTGKEIEGLVLAGNTTMLHLLLGLDPRYISVAPFIPVSTEGIAYGAGELGFRFNEACSVYVMPSLSGYIGADIIAGMLTTGLQEVQSPCLFVDIGTNGEIALAKNGRIVCCSTAAGPAFEGAHIRNGMGGVSGAINSVQCHPHPISYTTLSNCKPVGICGSGIVDAVAVLLELGVIDETGRFLDSDEMESVAPSMIERMIEIEGMKAFCIALHHETDHGEAVVITQKDIREVQLAKASIAAGIHTLVKQLGISLSEITTLYLAGGFGSTINRDSAVKIGLLPKALQERIVIAGNAAGTGAVMTLLSRDHQKECTRIAKLAEYIELSAQVGFQDEFVDCMYF